ncbi:MFS transporter [Phenylobacterium hankyongense]|uniref:MFS transporter n=2 Tax=Phenylobacterium hankyongense TaxID=1813876 RepID=A0A328B7C3_9CAUL|nr:MFS transporter [Phenylobacterium hankyongense]
MFAIAAVSYLDRNNISIAASAVQKEFGLTNVQLGTVFSAFVMGYAFSQPLAGRLADRFGPYRMVAIGIVWWSVFTAATALVPSGYGWSLGLLIATRFVLGVGESVIFPASNRLVANWIPTRERGVANGVIFAGVGIGAGVAPPLITYFLINHDWRVAFYASAVIGLASLIGWLVVARDRPDIHPWVDPTEAAYIKAGLPDPTALGSHKAAPWLQILKNRHVAALSLSYFCYGYVAYIFFTWFFKYLSTERGLDLKASALYAMLPFIAMAVCSPLGGWMADRLTDRFGPGVGRRGLAVFALVLAAAFVAMATQVADARLACVVLAGGAGALYLSQSAFWTVSANLGGRSAGSVSGVMNMANQLGGVVTASLTALLADRLGWNASFLAAAGVSLVGAAAWLFIDPTHRLASDATGVDAGVALAKP